MKQATAVPPTPPTSPAPPAVPVQAPVVADPNVQLTIDVIRSEIQVLRQEINTLGQQLVPGISSAREETITDRISATADRIESLEEQLDRVLAGQPMETSTEQYSYDEPPAIPPDVMRLVEWSLIALVMITLGNPIVRVISRRFDRSQARNPAPETNDRMNRLEQAVDAVAIEVERISEGQRYTNKVISELRGLPAPNPLGQWQGQEEREAAPAADRANR